MRRQPQSKKQQQDYECDPSKLSNEELIELAGGQRAFNEKFYEIFGDLKKE